MSNLKFNSHSSKLMYSHLKLTLGLPKANAIMTEIHKWMESNGPEWTVDRLKALKTWFIQHLAGNTSYSEPWFEKSQVNGLMYPKGPFGSLFKDVLMSKHRHDKKIIKVLSSLMVYTGIRLKKPSTKQILKTVGSIQGPTLDKPRVAQLTSMGKTLKSALSAEQLNLIKAWKRQKDKGFNFKPVSLNTGKPFTSGGERYLRSFVQGLHVPQVRAYFQDSFKDFPELVFPTPKLEELPPTEENILRQPLAGSIVILQEPGAKARVIANPNAAAQIALAPLHGLLDELLQVQTTDCTHDQEAGAKWAFDQLASGKQLFSVDLSGATDNFPISLQLSLLRNLGLRAEADLIQNMAGGIWMLHPDLHTDLINGGHQIATTYTKGQPQGLYSSFPLFGLTHNLLCSSLCRKLEIPVADSFRVLGDDIIINDERLHTAYREFMLKSGVPISEQKSLSSDTLGEFAGYIITSKGYYKPAKVPKPDTDKPYEVSFTNYLKVVGIEGIRYLPSKVRKVAQKVATLPEVLGGLGFNPKGLSFEDRIKSFIENQDINLLDEVPKYFSMQGNFSALHHSGGVPEYAEPALDWIHDQWTSYESKVSDILSQMPRLATLADANISEPHSLAYQMSLLPEYSFRGNVYLGNKAVDAEASQKPFLTDFQLWKRKFQDEMSVYTPPTGFTEGGLNQLGSTKGNLTPRSMH